MPETTRGFGAFLPILSEMDTVELSTAPNDPAMGHTTPVLDSVPRWFDQTIQAYPEYGYEFVSWSDGSRENPRVVTMTNSMHFVAQFDTNKSAFVVTTEAYGGHGTVDGGGIYMDGDTMDLHAVPNAGWRFNHWNDSSRSSFRRIRVRANMHFTAFFSPDTQYTVRVCSSDTSRGRVVGGGMYYAEDTARIAATTLTEQYVFSHWNDGDTTNPREFLVVCDTAFTATFVDTAAASIVTVDGAEGMFGLTPNPASGKVTVRVTDIQATGQQGRWTVTLRDVAGHMVLQQTIDAGRQETEIDLLELSAGAYFVTVTQAGGTATRRLVVK